MCNIHKELDFIIKTNIKKLICLSVLKATTFFISKIVSAHIPAINILITINKKVIGSFLRDCILHKRITPAHTRVLEWTKALVVVGAFIDKGNQVIKGNWAALVKQLIINKKDKIYLIDISSTLALRINTPRVQIINASPTLLDNTTTSALNFLVQFIKWQISKKDVQPKPSHPTIIVIEFSAMIKILIDKTKSNLNEE